MSTNTADRRSFARALLYAIPIGGLGGLIGLGGAEFRLPVLVGALGYSAKQAVPLNLAISLVTLASALVSRTRALRGWVHLVQTHLAQRDVSDSAKASRRQQRAVVG